MSLKLYFFKFLAFFGGCYSCYLSQVYAQQSTVTSAAIVGLVGSFLHFPKFYENKGLHAAIFAGALAAMCSRSILENPTHIFLLSMIGATIYLLAKPHANGLGGKLGTIAFISCGLFFLMRNVW